jgi:membrane AbrB-like protein
MLISKSRLTTYHYNAFNCHQATVILETKLLALKTVVTSSSLFERLKFPEGQLNTAIGKLLAAVFAGGYICHQLHLPASWLIGSMVVSAIFAMKEWGTVKLHRSVYLLIQAVIGISLSGTFSTSSLKVLSQHWMPVGLVVVLMVVFTVLNALYLIVFARLNPATAMLGSLPGGAGEMTAISESMGADPRLVSVIQYVRLLIIILSVSLISHAAGGVISACHFSSVHTACDTMVRLEPTLTLANIGLCLGVAITGGWLGTISKVPAGTLIVPMLFSIALSAAGHPIAWPAPVLAFAYTTMGMMIGARFDTSTLDELKRLCTPLLLTTFSLMVGSILLAVLFVFLMPINALSAYLASTPGGLDSIAVMANELHADAAIVITVHFCRLMLVLIFGPPLVSVFAKYCNKWRISEKSSPRNYTENHEKSHSQVRRSPAASSRP